MTDRYTWEELKLLGVTAELNSATGEWSFAAPSADLESVVADEIRVRRSAPQRNTQPAPGECWSCRESLGEYTYGICRLCSGALRIWDLLIMVATPGALRSRDAPPQGSSGNLFAARDFRGRNPRNP